MKKRDIQIEKFCGPQESGLNEPWANELKNIIFCVFVVYFSYFFIKKKYIKK